MFPPVTTADIESFAAS
jgi:hypothetical protein